MDHARHQRVDAALPAAAGADPEGRRRDEAGERSFVRKSLEGLQLFQNSMVSFFLLPPPQQLLRFRIKIERTLVLSKLDIFFFLDPRRREGVERAKREKKVISCLFSSTFRQTRRAFFQNSRRLSLSLQQLLRFRITF
jgi:hypothetical protein